MAKERTNAATSNTLNDSPASLLTIRELNTDSLGLYVLLRHNLILVCISGFIG